MITQQKESVGYLFAIERLKQIVIPMANTVIRRIKEMSNEAFYEVLYSQLSIALFASPVSLSVYAYHL